MQNGDALGDEGRKALNACVKVKIYGKPETRRYDRQTALDRLCGCFGYLFDSSPRASGAFQAKMGILQGLLLPSPVEGGDPVTTKTYNIIDIHDALENFDERSYVEKYPREGPGSDKLRDLIDKRRADVEKELEEAYANPDGQQKYSWLVAQRRVRDCFAGNFPEDDSTLLPLSRGQDKMTYSICDIHEALVRWDDATKKSDVHRAAVEKEIEEAIKSAAAHADTNVQRTPEVIQYPIQVHHYDGCEAEDSVWSCCPYSSIWCRGAVPITMDKRYPYSIFDIHKAVVQFDGKKLLQKYPDEGPGSEELKKVIDKNRTDIEEEYLEYQKATSDTGSKPQQRRREYSWSEAEHRVRDCFAGTFLRDKTEIFPNIEKDEHDQTYDIFDIKQAVDQFDAKTFGDVCKYNKEPSCNRNQEIDEQRECIQREYDEATKSTAIEHGSGFIVHEHFIITNRHVIETYLDKPKGHEIRISNEAICDDLPCEVIHYDAGKDLALLYCPDLKLEHSGICPLQLSSHPLLPGMSIFSFGYPMSHTEETALFVSGSVSGFKKTLAGHSMVVLNCSLNSGNSGGPVMCWVNGQLRVVGVATQKHFKEILTPEERVKIEKIRESLQTFAIPDLPDSVINSVSPAGFLTKSKFVQPPLSVLTLKLYDALETHSQFNLSNALPGYLVVEFIKSFVSKYTGECKEELEEIVKLSAEPVVCNGT